MGIFGVTVWAMRLTTNQRIGQSWPITLLYILYVQSFQVACSIAIYTTTKLALSIARKVVGPGVTTLSGLLKRLKVGMYAGCGVCVVIWVIPLMCLVAFPEWEQPLVGIILVFANAPFYVLGLIHAAGSQRIKAALTTGMETISPAQRKLREGALASVTRHSKGIWFAMLISLPPNVVFAAYEPLRQVSQYQLMNGSFVIVLVLMLRLKIIVLPNAGRGAQVAPKPQGAGGQMERVGSPLTGGGRSLNAAALSSVGREAEEKRKREGDRMGSIDLSPVKSPPQRLRKTTSMTPSVPEM